MSIKYLILSAPLLTACLTDTEPALDEATHEIAQVVLRPGVSASACNAAYENCWDSTGHFADIALLRLESHSDTFDENDRSRRRRSRPSPVRAGQHSAGWC